mmetsp:Transcript_28674/g.67359  ORF Transcript_28674/g.67359 Transcript_28674/m.67359 type:complete len:305 (+) Transcript_28674:1879-2793(+)
MQYLVLVSAVDPGQQNAERLGPRRSDAWILKGILDVVGEKGIDGGLFQAGIGSLVLLRLLFEEEFPPRPPDLSLPQESVGVAHRNLFDGPGVVLEDGLVPGGLSSHPGRGPPGLPPGSRDVQRLVGLAFQHQCQTDLHRALENVRVHLGDEEGNGGIVGMAGSRNRSCSHPLGLGVLGFQLQTRLDPSEEFLLALQHQRRPVRVVIRRQGGDQFPGRRPGIAGELLQEKGLRRRVLRERGGIVVPDQCRQIQPAQGCQQAPEVSLFGRTLGVFPSAGLDGGQSVSDLAKIPAEIHLGLGLLPRQ